MNEGWRITPGHRSFNRANCTMRNLSENQNACISRKMCAREDVFVTRKGECDLEHQAPRSGSAYISWIGVGATGLRHQQAAEG